VLTVTEWLFGATFQLANFSTFQLSTFKLSIFNLLLRSYSAILSTFELSTFSCAAIRRYCFTTIIWLVLFSGAVRPRP
jgi:hypothetical protein